MTYEQIKALTDSDLTSAYIAAEKVQPRFVYDQRQSFIAQRAAWSQLPQVRLAQRLSTEMDYRFSDHDAAAVRAERAFGC